MPETDSTNRKGDRLMYTRIAVALIVAFLLSAGAWKIYTLGEKSVQAKWDKQTTKMTEDALKLSEENRAKEQALQTKVRKVTNDYIAEKKRNAASTAVTAGRMYELQSALDSLASSETITTGRADDPRGRISGECASALGKMDEYAQGLASKTRGLQDYASNVCVAK